jgi:hypothetical protein
VRSQNPRVTVARITGSPLVEPVDSDENEGLPESRTLSEARMLYPRKTYYAEEDS